MSHLLARVENFNRFEGEELLKDPVMRYGQTGETPHEMYNFAVASDGFIYGHLPRNGGGELSRLGGDEKSEYVENVTVIFISDGYICGYYRNAIVYAAVFRHPDKFKAGSSKIHCRAKVNPKDAFLVPPERRVSEIKPRPKGQFPVLYGDMNTDWVQWFENWAYDNSNKVRSEKKRRRTSTRIERDSRSRKWALDHYGRVCECCGVSYHDNIRSAVFEVHHKKPFSDDFESREVQVADLAVLCANCHRMVHRMSDLSDIGGLKRFLQPN